MYLLGYNVQAGEGLRNLWYGSLPILSIIYIKDYFKKRKKVIFRTRFLEILDSFPDATACFTDVCKTHNRADCAYSIGDNTFTFRHRNSASTNHRSTGYFWLLPPPPLHSSWSPQTPYPPCPQPPTYTRHTPSFPESTHSYHQIPGHVEILGNEKVDKKAKEPTIYPRMPVPLFPSKSNLTRYAPNIITSNWTLSWKNQRDTNQLATFKPHPFEWPSSNQHSQRLEILYLPD